MALTDVAIRNAKPKDKPYQMPDKDGLYLEVKPNGSKLWRFRYRFRGQERRLGLGEYPYIGLKEAREIHLAMRQQLAHGQDYPYPRTQHSHHHTLRQPLYPSPDHGSLHPISTSPV